jgi:glutamyl-tRNA synthetase
MSRILSMNEHYIKTIDEKELYDHLVRYCEIYKEKIKPEKETKIKPSLTFLKNKAKTLEDIFNNAKYIIFDDVKFEDKDLELIDDKAKNIIKEFKEKIISIKSVSKETLEPVVNNLIKKYETNFKGVGQPLRVALTGSKFGPGLYDIIISLGKEEVEKRLGNKIVI